MGTLSDALKWLFKTIFTVIIVFAVLIFFIMAFVAKLSYENFKNVTIPYESYLVLSFSSDILEAPSEIIDIEDFTPGDLSRKKQIFGEVLQKVSFASEDRRIKGVILDLDNWELSFEHTHELSDVLNKFRENNKEIIAYGSGFDKGNYLAALSADEIIADPSVSATILLNGMSVSVPYFKDIGDKIGMNVEVIHIGEYKGSGENFTRDKMSDQFRTSIERIIDDRLDLFTGTVSEKRKLEKAEVFKKVMNGEIVLITLEEALEMDLVDRLLPYDKMLSERMIGEKQLVRLEDYSRERTYDNTERVAVIYAEGNIVDSDEETAFSEPVINPVKFDRILKKIRKDDKIKAVVLRVNSPGGSALASEKILRQIINLKGDMPVVVSMGSIAASGGYYISCHGSRIFADPYTVTGSIGVVSMIPNFKKMLDSIGINNEKIVRGKYSDIFDLTKEKSAEDSEIMRKAMERVYIEFKGRVSSGRNIDPDSLEQIAQGQIWTGRQAKENGLVDDIGGINSAIEEAARLAGIENYDIIGFPENRSFSEKIFSTEGMETAVKTPFKDSGYFADEIENIRMIMLYGNKPLTLMPVIFTDQ